MTGGGRDLTTDDGIDVLRGKHGQLAIGRMLNHTDSDRVRECHGPRHLPTYPRPRLTSPRRGRIQHAIG